MGLIERRRWRVRVAFVAALGLAAIGVSWLVPSANEPLAALAGRLERTSARIQPLLIGEHFLLQAVTCQERFGLACTPIRLPDGRGSVSRRPSINPDNAISRREARREIREGLGSGSAWLRALAATPGAALFTARYVSGQGWDAWALLALSLAVALAVLFWLVDSALLCVALAPVVAIAVSWALASTLHGLASTGWQAPFLLLVAIAVFVAGFSRDLFEASATFERYTRWRWRRQQERAWMDA